MSRRTQKDIPTKPPSIRFDVAGMFVLAAAGEGGAASLRRLLVREFGCAPAGKAVQMWKTRNVIPQAWIAPVLLALSQEVPAAQIRHFIEIQQEQGS